MPLYQILPNLKVWIPKRYDMAVGLQPRPKRLSLYHTFLLDGVCNPIRNVSFAGWGLQPRPKRLSLYHTADYKFNISTEA